MRADELVEKYIRLRDKKGEIKKEFDAKVEKIDEALDQIEGVLLKTFDSAGIENIKTAAGTAYVSTRTSASVADRDSYFGWVLEEPEERLVFLEARANKTALDQYREAHQSIPPGINWREERTVNIRRS